nr:unnamed protein product [Spirometra erinaceieuropaei]
MNPPSTLSDCERRKIEARRLEALSRRNRGASVPLSVGMKRPFSEKSFPPQKKTLENRVTSEVVKVSQPLVGLPLRQLPVTSSIAKGSSASSAQPYIKRPEPSGVKSTRFGKQSKMPGGVKRMTKATCVLISPDRFEVQSGYHAGLTLVFNALPSRRYDHKSRKWNFLLSDYNKFLNKAAALDDVQLEGLSSAVVSTFKSKICGKTVVTDRDDGAAAAADLLTERLPRSLVDSLMAFQREGVRLGLQRGGRILLADDMGLGKTLQGLAIAAAFRSEWPLLIVTPSSVRFSWREQILRWLGGPLNIHRSDIDVVSSARAFTTDDYLNPRQGPSLITVFSYDLLSRCAAKLSEFPPFGVVIMDESHFLKNFKTARTKAAMPLLKAAKRAILLTGTPALSRPMELFPQITAVRPSLFKGGFHEFGLRYCAAKENPWGWDYSGCSNMQELQIILEETIMISDVLSQLPPKRREVVILDPSLVKAGSINHFECSLSAVDLKALEKHGELLRYFKETSRVKLPAVEQYVSDLLESDRKFIVFAHHTEMLDAINRLLDSKSVRFIRIDGRTPSDQRRVVCERFQLEETCKVALLSITAAGTGINLTAATLVVFAELFWNPGVLIQAEDRAYRIGQQDSVNVRYLLAEGTADDHIWALVKTKLDVLTRAGLNQESFENVDLTRAQCSSAKGNTQTLDSFFTKPEFEFPPDVMAAFDEPLSLPQPVSETPAARVLLIEDRVSRRLSPLFPVEGPAYAESSSSSAPSSCPPDQATAAAGVFCRQRSQTVLVPASPEHEAASPPPPPPFVPTTGSSDGQTGHAAEEGFPDEDDAIFQEAAVAAETKWLTEALLSDQLDDSTFS